MNNEIIENWNARVRTDDTVYILGDFIWAKESDWPFFVGRLAGNKVLIRGNHDPRQFSSTTKRMFQDITNLKETATFMDGRSDGMFSSEKGLTKAFSKEISANL